MRTPKQLFLASGHASALKAFAATADFEPACVHALMQLQSEMAPTALPRTPVDPYVAIDANSQMWGARRVLEILHALSQPEEPTKQPKKDTLHYE